MATYRIGIGTEFKLDGGVGIGTATAPSGLGNLKVTTANGVKNDGKADV